jgi:hypothetical protein
MRKRPEGRAVWYGPRPFQEDALSLREMLRDDSADVSAIAAYLDGLAHPERLAETRTLGRSEQRRLYRAAERAAPLTLDHFVPASAGARVAVHHHGRNTLPLPSSLKLFEKRFARPVGAAGAGQHGGSPRPPERLFGYNQSPFLGTIGPGFFVAVSTARDAGSPGYLPEWEARGAVVVDYFQIPDGPVPESWPPVVPNTKGLQTFVYHRTRDFMRRVSAHVTIGAAYKVEKALDHYFVLCKSE